MGGDIFINLVVMVMFLKCFPRKRKGEGADELLLNQMIWKSFADTINYGQLVQFVTML